MQISLKKQGNIAVISIERPDVMNSLDSESVKELGEVLNTVRNDNSMRAAVITGSRTEAF